MSDEEGDWGGGSSEDLVLPKATVAKAIQELLPNDIVCAKDARDLVAECGKEFITLITSEANDICEKGSKKTIMPEHITEALKVLGFESYLDDVEEVAKDHKVQTKERVRKANKFEASGMTEEELLAYQQQLLAASKARFDAGQQ